MAQGNSKRISHDLEEENNTFRQDDLQNILTDVDQDLNDIGFQEVTRDGNNFVTNIIIWTDSGKTKKLLEFDYVRTSPPFLDSFTKKVYAKDGVTVASTVTQTATRNANKTINQITSGNVRS